MPPDNGSENCLAIGTRLVDFEITGILGEGGFGVVYVAFDHSLQRTVAIKEYMPGTLSARADDGGVVVRAERHRDAFDAGLKSFINEARLLAQFDHPSLVKVYRFWEQNKTAYMAMRYYDGQTLKDIVHERPEIVTEAWLKFIFKQILEALDTLYRAKVLHRDVSPDNIIVQKNGDAVLLDFGSARQIIGDMTQGLTVILKPGYAPVEQYSDDAEMAQGPWTDIYALAAVMYFAIAKNPPITSVSRMIKDSLVLLQEGAHVGFSYKFLVAIDKGLALQPEDRPQTMDEFRRLLGIAAFSSSRSSRSSSRSSRSGRSAEAGAEVAAEVVKEPESSPKIQSGPKTGIHPKLASRVRHSEEPQTPPEKSRSWQAWFGLGLGALLLSAGAWYGFKGNPPSEQLNPSGPTPEVLPSAIESKGQGSALPAKPHRASKPPKVSANTKTESATPAAASNVGNNASLSDSGQPILNAASTAPEPEPVFSARMKVNIKPWGQIYIDDKLAGTSPPLKIVSVPEGKHRLRITNPAFPEITKEVEVIKGKKRLEPIDIDFTVAK